ncbi:MAG TPA: hypothetical protein PKG60_16675 [Spirochaetota bacterium]|nr:hypothetical protein [Spirochaetota bacterium]
MSLVILYDMEKDLTPSVPLSIWRGGGCVWEKFFLYKPSPGLDRERVRER